MSRVLDFQHASWNTMAAERVADGIERQMIWGERLMVCRARFAPHVVAAVHSHAHEQMTLVEEGHVLFTVGGQQIEASAGDVLSFPPHIEHGMTILDKEAVLLDVFTPVRSDFLPHDAIAVASS